MWGKLRVELVGKINDRLWNEKEGFYLDRRKNGSWVGVKTVDDFLPLTAGVATEERAHIIVEDHLTSEEEFWPVFPVPSVALNEKTFELDMWRGPTWINYNWMIIRGLRRYGFEDVADDIVDRSIGEICRWRSERGSIYEFYDPLGKRAPQDLKRKGRIRRWSDDGIPVVSDYFWSSALFVDMVAGKCGLDTR
jgi:neutral trehalase